MNRLLSLALIAVAGCSSKNSSSGGANGAPIGTEDMHFNASVEASDDTTAKVRVWLNDGRVLFPTKYHLTGGDTLTACVLGTCTGLGYDLILVTYEAELPYVADQDYTISLNRGTATGTSAPGSSVTLPPPFQITLPVDGEQVTDDSIVLVAWSPIGSGDPVRTETTGTCRHEDGALTVAPGGIVIDFDRDGVAEVSIDDLLQTVEILAESTTPVQRCAITIDVIHGRTGNVASAYAGGFFVGRTVRSVSLTYLPP